MRKQYSQRRLGRARLSKRAPRWWTRWVVVALIVPVVMGVVAGYLGAGQFMTPAPVVTVVAWQLPERDLSSPAQPDVIEIAALAPLLVVDQEAIAVATGNGQTSVPDMDAGYVIDVDPPSTDAELVADLEASALPMAGKAHAPSNVHVAYGTGNDLPVPGAAHAPHEIEVAYGTGHDNPMAGVAHAPHDIDGSDWLIIDPRSRIHAVLDDRARLMVATVVDVTPRYAGDWRLESRREADMAALMAMSMLPDPPLPMEPPELPAAAVQIEPNTYDEALVLPEAFDTEPEIYRAPDPVEPNFDNSPVIAIVIDDLGLNRQQTAAVSALPGPLTMAFIPYAEDLAGQTASAHGQGHEIFLHLPMEPIDSSENPGPNALTSGLSDADLQVRLIENLNRFTGYVGVNNHMGSRLTQDDEAMTIVMAELKRRGLLFLDSVTIARSVAHAAALAQGVPSAQRDIFLDNDPNVPAILHQLALLESVAMKQGYAIAIGHPHVATVSALTQWLPLALERGYRIVPASQIITRRAIILAHYMDARIDE